MTNIAATTRFQTKPASPGFFARGGLPSRGGWRTLEATTMTKKGYKQTPEHTQKIKRFGPDHHAYLGDSVSEKGGRTRAQRKYPTIGSCEHCGNPAKDRHHKDGDTANNSPENIAVLCRRCHMKEDGRLEEARLSMLAIRKAGVAIAAVANRRPATAASGDPCPVCKKPLVVSSSKIRNGFRFRYIACKKSLGGCGYNAGSIKTKDGND